MFTKPWHFPSTFHIFIAWKKKGLSDLKASAKVSTLASASLFADPRSPNFAAKCQIIQGGKLISLHCKKSYILKEKQCILLSCCNFGIKHKP